MKNVFSLIALFFSAALFIVLPHSVTATETTFESVFGPNDGGLDTFDSGGTSVFRDGSTTAEPYDDFSHNPFNSGLIEIPRSGFDPGNQASSPRGQYANPFLWVMRTIMSLLTLVGMGTIAGIIYGGFLWMTSQGESSQVEKAKMTLRNSVIGLVIILSSYSITWWIVTQVIDTTAAFGGGFFLFGLF